MKSVVVADDHELFRAGIVRLIDGSPDLRTVGEAADGETAVALAGQLRPDVVLMDMSMPRLGGADATRRICEADPSAVVVVLSSFVGRNDVRGALDAGATGYLLKDSTPDDLLGGIRSALSEGCPISPRAAREVIALLREPVEEDPPARSFGDARLVIDAVRHEVLVDGRPRALTVTEYEILVALSRRPGRVYSRTELTTAACGHDYAGYERTVDAHVKNLRRKLDAGPEAPAFVQTVRGVGYRLAVAADQ